MFSRQEIHPIVVGSKVRRFTQQMDPFGKRIKLFIDDGEVISVESGFAYVEFKNPPSFQHRFEFPLKIKLHPGGLIDRKRTTSGYVFESAPR